MDRSSLSFSTRGVGVKTEVEVVAEDHNLCGEAPIWDGARQRLIWADISSSRVYQLFPASREKQIISRNLMVAGIALNRDGALIFAGSTGLHHWNAQDDHQVIVANHAGESLFFNDIIADSAGRLYAGTVYWGARGMEKTGKLYRIDPDGSVQIVADGIEMSNGLGFSPDNTTLYYADTSARRIFAYDVDLRTGALSRKRTLVQVPSDEGIPDGLTVDSQGFVWSAQWYGSQVVRYDPDGKVERRIAMPVKQVSSVAFGGKDFSDLYVTSAAESWPSPLAPPGYDFQAPNIGGSLYRVRLEIQGRPEHQANLRRQ